MYRIYIDNGSGEEYLYYPGDAEYVVADAVVKLKIGEAGSCEFSVPPSNPRYGSISNRKSMITVYRGSRMIFCGEVRESEKDRNKIKRVYAVGELAFLSDTVQPQYNYGQATPNSFLTSVLANHNSLLANNTRKQFAKGTVSVPSGFDASEKITDHNSTLDAIRTQLVERLGGCLRIRRVSGERRLDYIPLESYGSTNAQGINFGENMLDYSENMSASDVVTCLIPLGKRIEATNTEFEKRLDITGDSRAGGKDYLKSNAAYSAFGEVWKVVVFDDIDNVSDLYDAGQQWLSENQYERMVLRLTAVDLSEMDSNMDDMNLGDSIPIYAEPFGLNTALPIVEQSLNLMAPQKDTIVLCATLQNKKMSISGQVGSNGNSITQATHKMELKIRNAIRQENANIMASFLGVRGGHRLEEFDQDGLWLKTSYIDGPTKAQSTTIIEFSMDGIRFYNGVVGGYTDPTNWKTAWTVNGQFCADLITTGTMMAERIYGGILTDKQGKNSWNMETGLLQTSDAIIKGTFQSGNITPSNPNGITIESNGSTIIGWRYGNEISWIDMSSSVGGIDTGLQIGGKGVQIFGKLYTTTNPNNPYDFSSGVLPGHTGNVVIDGDTYVFYNGLLCYKVGG